MVAVVAAAAPWGDFKRGRRPATSFPGSRARCLWSIFAVGATRRSGAISQRVFAPLAGSGLWLESVSGGRGRAAALQPCFAAGSRLFTGDLKCSQLTESNQIFFFFAQERARLQGQ